MRLITLNTWGGRSLYPLIRFFERWADRTDIFCLQEVFSCSREAAVRRHPSKYRCKTLFREIQLTLGGFDGFFAAHEGHPEWMSLAMFVRRGLATDRVISHTVHRPKASHGPGGELLKPRKIQYAVIENRGTEVMVANYHGLWSAGHKRDTPERLDQSNSVRRYLEREFRGPRVLCGDFNLLPDTESMRILETGMRNLVTEAGVRSTRTVLYRNFDSADEPNLADYVLASPEIDVRSFEVLSDVVSDHAPLRLEI